MKTKKVALIKEDISAVGYGCWVISGPGVWGETKDQESIGAVKKALEMGVNFFDVAPIYGMGYAEKILGQALKGARDKVMIATKCGLVWDDRKRVAKNVTEKSIFQEIDQSLKRLQTDYVDLYQVHWPDPATPIEETMGALMKIKESGKIKYIGVSNFSLQLTEEAFKYGEVVSHQGLYNMLERNATSYHNTALDYRVDKEILPLCQARGMAFLPYSPLLQGLLTGKFDQNTRFSKNDIRYYNPNLKNEQFKKNLVIVDQLKELGRQIDKPLNQIAINWLIKQPNVTSVICGARNEEQVEKNAGSVAWELTDQQFAQIEKIIKS